MLPFLRLNNPTISFALSVLLLILVRIFLFNIPLTTEVWTINAAPLAVLAFKLFPDLLINKVFNFSASLLIVLFLAFKINSLINNDKILGETNYFFSWILVLLSCTHPAFLIVSPAMIALVFYVFLFQELYGLKEDKKSLTSLFNLGLFFSLSILIWYPGVVLIVLIFIGLFMFSSIMPRMLLALFIGVLIPFIYIVFYFFWLDGFPNEFTKAFSFFEISFIDLNSFLNWPSSGFIFILLMTFSGMISLLQYSQKVVKEIRQFISLLLIFTFLYFFVSLIQFDKYLIVFVPMIFPFAVCITMMINTIKRKLLAELAHLSLLLLVVLNLIFA